MSVDYFTREDLAAQEATTKALREAVTLFATRRSIGPIVLDATVEERHHDEIEITSHPVQEGASISDHAYRKPSEVVIRGGVSDSTDKTTVFPGGFSPQRTKAAYEALLKLQGDREPFDVVTGKRAYKNMLIKSVLVNTDRRTENVLDVMIALREVIIVGTQTVAIPASRQKHAKKTAKAVNKGTKSAKKKDVPQSILFKAGVGSGGR